MHDSDSRRDFLRRGAAGTAAFIAGAAAAPLPAAQEEPGPGNGTSDAGQAGRAEDPPRSDGETGASQPFGRFSRWEPTFGGPPDSDDYLGKLVPGRRGSGLEPVPLTMPDLGKVPWEMVRGRKEYRLVSEHVRREFLPGYWMDVWGYNGSMPGPLIEANQGDKVRIVVENRLPEPTTVHWHGFELPVSEDGVPGLTQDPIAPGKTYVYEFDLHQAGTFFYHSHMPMQEAFGMVGLFVVHPHAAFDPPVDRDFGLIFQNFAVPPNQTVPDSMAMEWNWHTINGRSGPYTTPLVCRHGERVRVRLLDFSPMQHHPIHLHGHTFWITGMEGARIPKEAWVPRNTTLIGVAQATEFEFIAFNPGDWIFHCHMVHHMMNHMVRQVGPRIRDGITAADYQRNLYDRPRVPLEHEAPAFEVRGYPQMMQGEAWNEDQKRKINGRRETRGMRPMWHMGVKGLMTVVRVLPDELYELVTESDDDVAPGAVFDRIVRKEYGRPG